MYMACFLNPKESWAWFWKRCRNCTDLHKLHSRNQSYAYNTRNNNDLDNKMCRLLKSRKGTEYIRIQFFNAVPPNIRKFPFLFQEFCKTMPHAHHKSMFFVPRGCMKPP